MHIAFITVGNPGRFTGGYLYHARLFAGLRTQNSVIDQIVASGAALEDQQRAADRFGMRFDPLPYDVVVIDALARGVVAPWIEEWHRARPVVVLVHQLPSIAEADEARIAVERALEEPLLRADHLIAVSAHGRQMLLDRGVSWERVSIASPGFDRLVVPEGKYAHSPRRHAFPSLATNLQPHTLHVLCVAQWVPRKGITTLIEAWNRGAWPGAILELIGETDADPVYEHAVRSLIAASTTNSIVVHGTVPDDVLSLAYQRADLFVLPSRFEGYGMVYAEAMAHGLPVVASNVGPVPDLVTQEAGLFVPPDDPIALYAALDQLIMDSTLRNRLATGARRRATELPAWDDTVRQFGSVLQRVLAR